MKLKVEGNRIAWLDSCLMPSRIHRTVDDGFSTVCGHESLRENWIVTDKVPRKMAGRTRYCVTCFKNGGKTLPWSMGC